MRPSDGLEVVLVRDHDDYAEEHVSHNCVEQPLRDQKGKKFEDDRLLASYAAVHRHLSNATDEAVKVVIRFSPPFKMFSADYLQVKICTGGPNAAHTYHEVEPFGGFVEPKVLGMESKSDKGIPLPLSKARTTLPGLTWTRSFTAAPGTIAVFITRGAFASDLKKKRANLGFTPIRSKNGHTYVFQFQCLAKGSPIASGAAVKSGKTSKKVAATATAQMPIFAPQLSAPRAASTFAGAGMHDATAEVNGRVLAVPTPRQSKQTTIGFGSTKRKASPGPSVNDIAFRSGSGLTKRQRRLSQESFTDDRPSPFIDESQSITQSVPPAVVKDNRPIAHSYPQSRGASKQVTGIIDLTLSDDEDDISDPSKDPAMSEIKSEAVEKGQEDMEELQLELHKVELQLKIKALRKKSRQEKVDGIQIKEETE